MLLYIGIIVFGLMVVGLVLTVIEFRYGQPNDQAESTEDKSEEPNSVYIPADDRC